MNEVEQVEAQIARIEAKASTARKRMIGKQRDALVSNLIDRAQEAHDLLYAHGHNSKNESELTACERLQRAIDLLSSESE